jgi:hypothetical protein
MVVIVCGQYKESNHWCNQIASIDAQENVIYSFSMEDRVMECCLLANPIDDIRTPQKKKS